ncbi:hypothetical protein BHM03_00004518 [Ensete ventricosum]|nr:hypothetical protein BHM03_00004518 [Ensete ventricosum]
MKEVNVLLFSGIHKIDRYSDTLIIVTTNLTALVQRGIVMVGVLNFPYLKSDLRFIFFPEALLHNGTSISLSTQCTISVGRWSANNSIDLLLYQTMGARGRLSGSLHITPEVSLKDEFLNLVLEVMTLLCVMVIVLMKTIILGIVRSSHWASSRAPFL